MSHGQHIGFAGGRLVCAIPYLGFLFQTTPAGVVAEPNQITFAIGHLSRDADLVAVEVVGLLSTSPSSLMLFRQAKPRTCVLHIPYVKTEGFVRATVCYNLLTEYFMLEEEIPSSNYY